MCAYPLICPSKKEEFNARVFMNITFVRSKDLELLTTALFCTQLYINRHKTRIINTRLNNQEANTNLPIIRFRKSK